MPKRVVAAVQQWFRCIDRLHYFRRPVQPLRRYLYNPDCAYCGAPSFPSHGPLHDVVHGMRYTGERYWEQYDGLDRDELDEIQRAFPDPAGEGLAYG